MQADKFYINEVEYVVEDLPEVENNDSNLATVTATVVQRNVIGINTHDTGFDCDNVISEDTSVINRQETGKSGTGSFTIPAGYAVEYLHVTLASGSQATFQAGFSAGTYDIIPTATIYSGTGYKNIDVGPSVEDIDNDYTFYYNVSGAGATCNIYLAATKIKDI